jgi:hypothetical protein
VCGIDVETNFDENKNVWIVDLKKGAHHLKTHLEAQDALRAWKENNVLI